MRRLGRLVLTTLKAVLVCHAQKAAPTLTTVFEIAALAAPLIKAPAASATGRRGGGSGDAASSHSAADYTCSGSGRRRQLRAPAAGAPLQLLLALSVRVARGWAPAVLLAQAVRLAGSLVVQRGDGDGKAAGEGTEVRALQLGLSVVPRVDPRVPRSLAAYCATYHEWLLLLRGRLAAAGVDLPEGILDEGPAGDEELMRFALCYNILQARSLKDALVAMDRTAANVKQFAAWHARYPFIAPGDLEAWQRIAWWEEGGAADGEQALWLMVDCWAAVQAMRTQGQELLTRVLVSNIEYGVRELMPELPCSSRLRIVVDTSGVGAAAALRLRGVFAKVGQVLDRMYPCRLQLLYLVGLPLPVRWAFRAAIQLLQPHTRRKVWMCRVTDVPRRLPSQLRSHKLLSVGPGLDAFMTVDSLSLYGDGRDGWEPPGTTASVVGSELEPYSGAGAGEQQLQPYTPGAASAASAVMHQPAGRPGMRVRRVFQRLQRRGVQGGGSARQQQLQLQHWRRRRRPASAAAWAGMLVLALLLVALVVAVCEVLLLSNGDGSRAAAVAEAWRLLAARLAGRLAPLTQQL